MVLVMVTAVMVIFQVDVVRTRMMVQRRLQGGEEGVKLYKSTIHCAYHTVSKFLLAFFLILQLCKRKEGG